MVETRCIVVPEGDSKQTWSLGTSGIFNTSVTFNSSQTIRHRLNMTVKIMNRIAKEGLTLEIWKGEDSLYKNGLETVQISIWQVQ